MSGVAISSAIAYASQFHIGLHALGNRTAVYSKFFISTKFSTDNTSNIFTTYFNICAFAILVYKFIIATIFSRCTKRLIVQHADTKCVIDICFYAVTEKIIRLSNIANFVTLLIRIFIGSRTGTIIITTNVCINIGIHRFCIQTIL